MTRQRFAELPAICERRRPLRGTRGLWHGKRGTIPSDHVAFFFGQSEINWGWRPGIRMPRWVYSC